MLEQLEQYKSTQDQLLYQFSSIRHHIDFYGHEFTCDTTGYSKANTICFAHKYIVMLCNEY